MPSVTANSAIDALRSRLSAESASAITAETATLDALASQGVRPAAIAEPASEKQACEIIRVASEQRLVVLPRGSGTGQGIGSPPAGNALVLSTRKLNQLVQHEPGDMVATVQAGIGIGELHRQLSAKGQFLPIDGDPASTIGGLIATDRHGPRALGYGTLRDMVLGMTVINGDGVARKCGGRVVKNVTGYDLNKLYIGSLGTLGLVTEVTFKLRPLPIASRFWGLHVTSINEAYSVLATIHAKNLPLDALTINFDRDAEPEAGVAVLASGANSELDRIARELNAPEATTTAIDGVAAAPAALDPWLRLQNLDRNPVSIIRFWCLPTRLPAAWDALKPGCVAAVFGMTGGLAALELKADALQSLIDKLNENGFHARVELLRGLNIARPFGPARPEQSLMQCVHRSLDAHAIMNRGRFVV